MGKTAENSNKNGKKRGGFAKMLLHIRMLYDIIIKYAHPLACVRV